MKIKALLLLMLTTALALSACGKKVENEQEAGTTPTPTTSPDNAADTVTTASIVNNAEAFQNAISADGTWIIALLNDLTIDDDLTLSGEFKNGKQDEQGNDIIQRKIALYRQDADRNITDRYTLTAPQLTVESSNASIQHGTFKGDLYINADNFELVDATVEGNVYFMNADVQNSFAMDGTSKITGTQTLLD